MRGQNLLYNVIICGAVIVSFWRVAEAMPGAAQSARSQHRQVVKERPPQLCMDVLELILECRQELPAVCFNPSASSRKKARRCEASHYQQYEQCIFDGLSSLEVEQLDKILEECLDLVILPPRVMRRILRRHQ